MDFCCGSVYGQDRGGATRALAGDAADTHEHWDRLGRGGGSWCCALRRDRDSSCCLWASSCSCCPSPCCPWACSCSCCPGHAGASLHEQSDCGHVSALVRAPDCQRWHYRQHHATAYYRRPRPVRGQHVDRLGWALVRCRRWGRAQLRALICCRRPRRWGREQRGWGEQLDARTLRRRRRRCHRGDGASRPRRICRVNGLRPRS